MTLYGGAGGAGGGAGVSVAVCVCVCVSKGKFGESRILAKTHRHMTELVTDLT